MPPTSTRHNVPSIFPSLSSYHSAKCSLSSSLPCHLPYQPESNYILTFRNEDRPGVISEVLQVLNNANVNVASLNVTRAGAGQVRGCIQSIVDFEYCCGAE
jgi:glycine cleavage system regulatory protein